MAGVAGDRLLRLRRPDAGAPVISGGGGAASRLGPRSASAPPGVTAAPPGRPFPCLLRSDGSPPQGGYTADPRLVLKDVSALKRLKRGADAPGLRLPPDAVMTPMGPPAPAGSAATAAADTCPTFALAARDSLRVCLIRVDFRTDRSGDSTSTPDGRFDLRTDVIAPVDPAPHNRAFYQTHIEALNRFYEAQSSNHLHITGTVFPTEPDSAFHLGDTADYGPWAITADALTVDVAAEAERLIKDSLEAARRSGQVDFNAFDAFLIVHAGADFQSDIDGDSPHDIPTFVLEFAEPFRVDGKLICRTMVLPETTTQDDSYGAINSVIAHEFGHILGLWDLYNVRNGVPMVGLWSLMDSGTNLPAILVDPADDSEVAAYGVLPPSFDAWSRLQLWGGTFLAAQLDVVEDTLTTSLESVIPSSRLALVDIHDSEYYLMENRAQDLDGNGFPIIRQDRTTGVILGPEADSTLTSGNTDGRFEYDALLPAGGLLVWHVDNAVIAYNLSIGDGLNTHLGRRGVKIIEADGIEDQGRRNIGTAWDPFYAGNATRFGPHTVPRTTSNDGQNTRITIETDSPPGRFMNLHVRKGMGVRGWPIGLNEATVVNRLAPLDLTGDHRPEMLFRATQSGKSFILAVQGRGGLPYPPLSSEGFATPLVTYNGTFDQRLAVQQSFRLGAGSSVPLIATTDPANGRLLAWGADGAAFPQTAALNATAAVTPAAADSEFVAFGDRRGGVYLAGAGGGGLDLRYRSTPNWIGQAPDTAEGSLVLGRLGVPGHAMVAWGTTRGRLRTATTEGAVIGVDGVGTLVDVGQTVDAVGVPPLRLLAANFRAPLPATPDQEYELAVIDARDRLSMYDLCGAPLPGWPHALAAPLIGAPAAGDVDGDGLAELVVADTLNQVTVYNDDGSPALGFPVRFFGRPTAGPVLADLDASPGVEILITTDDGSLHALTGRGREVTGFPLATGYLRASAPVLLDLDGDGRLDLAAGSPDHVLIGASLDLPMSDSLVVWSGDAGNPGRGFALDRRFVRDPASAIARRAGEIVCYPNPARGGSVHLRTFLTAGQAASASVFDVGGRPIRENLLPSGGPGEGETDILWEVGGVPPGIYLVRLSITGPGAPGTVWRTVAVVR